MDMDKPRNSPFGNGGGGQYSGRLCSTCGYQYTNPHPSAKLRRSHRKNCSNSRRQHTAENDGSLKSTSEGVDKEKTQTEASEQFAESVSFSTTFSTTGHSSAGSINGNKYLCLSDISMEDLLHKLREAAASSTTIEPSHDQSKMAHQQQNKDATDMNEDTTEKSTNSTNITLTSTDDHEGNAKTSEKLSSDDNHASVKVLPVKSDCNPPTTGLGDDKNSSASLPDKKIRKRIVKGRKKPWMPFICCLPVD